MNSQTKDYMSGMHVCACVCVCKHQNNEKMKCTLLGN